MRLSKLSESRYEEYCYFLDATGFVKVENYWNQAQVNKANSIIDAWLDIYAAKHKSIPTKFPFIDIDPHFFLPPMGEDLILKFGSRYCGSGFRFDHGIGLLQPTFSYDRYGKVHEGEATNLHGGPWGSQGSNFCVPVGNQFWFGQLNVGIVLAEQKADAGGLCYIPGTHTLSTNYSDGVKVLNDYLRGSFRHPSLLVPQLNPGDLVIFTEALIHGMAPWKSDGALRKNIYYKFSPGYLAWRPYDEVKKYLAFAQNETIRDLLRPPYVAGYTDIPTVGGNTFRTPITKSKTSRKMSFIKKKAA